MNTKREKRFNLRNLYFEKKSQKFKNIYTQISWVPSIKHLHFMTSSLNFTLK